MKNFFCLSTLLLLLLNVTLASCSSTTTVNKSEQPKAATNSREIKHAMGTTKVPKTPERVIVLTNEANDNVVALGIKPVGAVSSWWGDPYFEYIQSDLQQVPVVGGELQPSLEKIAALKPDLIIGSKVRHQNIYPQLMQIAPTVYSETLGADWKDNFTLYAQVLNREEQAQQMMEQWHQRVADLQTKIGSQLDEEVSVMRFLAGQARIYHRDNFAGKILAEIGFQRPASQQQDEFADEITLENIAEVDGDIIFYMAFDPENSESSKFAQKWIEHPLWQSLKAAQSDRVYEVNDVYWNTGAGIQAANKMLDDLYQYLLE